MSAKLALDRYYQRVAKQDAKNSRPRRKNQKPEEILKAQVLIWLRQHGFSVHAVESKAVFSQKLGRYMNSQAVPGFADIAGACPNGIGCFIELKAPGRRSTLRPAQRKFLLEKVNLGCFAVVIDSAEDLAKTWTDFSKLTGIETKRAYLSGLLPKENIDKKQIFGSIQNSTKIVEKYNKGRG